MQSTTNYGMFKSIPGNRDIIPNHVQRLVRAIESKNLLSQFPIVVNDKLEVIDGQHRLLAASELGVPIFYEVVKGLTIEDAIAINTASRAWTLSNFIDSWIERGKKDYVFLKEFKEKYNLGYTLASALLLGYNLSTKNSSTGGGSGLSRVVKRGDFRVNVSQRAETVATALQEIDRFTDFNARADLSLAGALVELLKLDEFDMDRLLGKFKTHQIQLQKRPTVRYYILELEEIYNFNTKAEKVTLYQGQA